MIITYHGGHCCGVKHVFGFSCSPGGFARKGMGGNGRDYDFNTHPGETNEQFFRRFCAANTGRLTEVILTATQIRYGWLPILQDIGFVLVSRFRNQNSNCICNVFHLRHQVTARLRNWRYE